MSEKFDLKLVIDAVTTPLLHARLCQSTSYRERAALLRSLAEAALRGSHVTSEPERQIAVRHVETAATAERNYQPPAAAPPLATRDAIESNVEEVRIHPVNENDGPGSHDADQLADAFGAFF
ncbi:hypothetical protein QYH69_22285 [Paraburkholderia sp. SARCC-3016]|uniref:hypothetical protein n=1 Tax=Paraburkholderia sp. SARCC-3016 TaxID=3058611 RepID=UPI002807BF39|nr:hypothetical protein [Paraburkholderia sp. SARCC-3016]MDQ7979974.1 hypothetical protein [Paraburkholderia sp. SARCC-3016]